MKYYQRLDCRLCGSKNLFKQMSLTATPPADSYITQDNKGMMQESIPLDLYQCGDCGHTQLGHVIDAVEVYTNYLYETASTLGLGSHFKKCANTVMKKFKPKKGGLVIDIGSNDGILLKYFKEHGMTILGVDPMPGIAEKASSDGVPTLPDFFTEEFAEKLSDEKGYAAIISSNNLVADTDDLTPFIKGVKKLMDKESIFFFETFYFYLQVKNFVWDFTYHEHYSYFTIKPLKEYFLKHGMEIIDVEDNETKGGSMRVTLQLTGGNRKIEDSVDEHIKLEEIDGFQTKKPFIEYKNKIEASKKEFRKFIDDLKVEKNSIVGYGASPTSTTLIYHFDMKDDLDYLVDDFEAKQGLLSPGYQIPVYPSSKISKEVPAYTIIIAWRYADKIIANNQDYLNKGGKFIIPLPYPRIVEKK
ncbi:class I SAM-dependent methyltransferase [bacterium]|nr:class I SAM-dependent methyltransferase [Pelagibacteraceae bacterium]MDC3130688.1 class I SAM-dependent methyltransferase [bacterium]